LAGVTPPSQAPSLVRQHGLVAVNVTEPHLLLPDHATESAFVDGEFSEDKKDAKIAAVCIRGLGGSNPARLPGGVPGNWHSYRDSSGMVI